MIDKKWEIKDRTEKEIEDQILKNRGIKKEDREAFFNPTLDQLKPPLDQFPHLKKAIDRIIKAIKKEEKIVIYGDFDVDGITAAAILWEVLFSRGAKVTPYIPHRVTEGYGLHSEAMEKFAKEGVKIVISVDCGITAVGEAKLAKKLGIDLIITDHHHPQENLPDAYALIHTESLCGAGIAFKIAWSIMERIDPDFSKDELLNIIDLAAIGTIADMVPLIDENRVLVTLGLEEVKKTSRLGIKAMFQEAVIKTENLRVYDISFVIAPRLNSMGRMESAMDSLRILLTKNEERARLLALRVAQTNQERQRVLAENLLHAESLVSNQQDNKIIVLWHESYAQGVIGLIAGRILEKTGKPTIVIAKEEGKSKGSARSIEGLSIVETIGYFSELLEGHGGHHMAAGFTIPTVNLEKFQKSLQEHVDSKYKNVDLRPVLKIDLSLEANEVNLELFDRLDKFKPFGIGNPEPLFVIKNLEVIEKKLVGKTSSHLKLTLRSTAKFPAIFEAMGFGMGEMEIKNGDKVDLAFTLTEDTFRQRKLVLKVKDFKTVDS